MKVTPFDHVTQVHEISDEVIDARLTEIDAREQAAEKGPWVYGDYGQFIFLADGGSMVAQMRGWGRLTANPGHLPHDKAAAQQDANGAFLAHARDDVPWLRNLVRELQACNARQEQLLKDAQVGWAADVAHLTVKYDAYKRVKEYWDDFHGEGLQIANWHLNGDLEPFDNFWESAQEEFAKGGESNDER